MLIIPKITTNGELLLDAFSFNRNEINAVSFILNKARIYNIQESLTKDIHGRFGHRFYIRRNDISKLESTLKLKFIDSGGNTEVRMDENYFNATGRLTSSYRCLRIDRPPNDCETIFADGDMEAIVKCAIVANLNNWIGASHVPGSC